MKKGDKSSGRKESTNPEQQNLEQASQNLRQKAEIKLSKKAHKTTPQNTADLLHELQVHQVELEMQNEELRRTELELQHSRDRYLDLYDNAPIGYFTLDHDSRILAVNLTGSLMLDKPRNSLLKIRLSSFVNPGSQDTLYFHLKNVLETGGKHSCEIKINRQDGTPIDVLVESVAREDTHGQVNHCFSTITDISAIRAAQELKLSEVMYRSLVNTSGAAIVTTDIRGNITFVNETCCLMLDYPKDELVGQSYLSFIYHQDLPMVKKEFDVKAVISTASSSRYLEFRVLCRDRSYLWVGCSQEPLIYNDKIAGFNAIMVNITESKKTEEVVKNAERKYRELAESISDVFFAMDRQLKYTYWNKASEELTGILSKDVLGKSLTQVFPDNESTRTLEVRYKMAIQTKQPQFFTTEYPGGKNIIHEISAYPSAEGVSVFVRDVTARKQAEDALKESEEFRKTLLENSSHPTVVRDLNDKVVYVNPAFERLSGYSLSEICGTTYPAQWWPEKDMAGIYEEHRSNSRSTWETIEAPIKMKTGEVRWTEVSSGPIMKDGQLQYRISNWLDITDRKKTEDLLKYQALLVDSVSDAVISTDLASNIVTWNKAAENIFGWTQAEVIGRTIRDIIGLGFEGKNPRESLKQLQAAINQVYTQGSWRGEQILLRKNGDRGTMSSTVSLILDASGKRVGVVGIYRDITEQKQAEAKILEMESLKIINRAKNDLLANVSHELRTPLASIKGFIETLIEPDVKWSKKQQVDYLRSANMEADRLNLLIKDLLDMSRIDSGKLALDKGSYKVSEILDSVSGVLSIVTAKHRLKISGVSDLPAVQVDKGRIGQVITNLVENAAKFSPEGSQIEIITVLQEEKVIVSIKDNGIGMPPEVVEKLFDRFYQAQQVVSGKTRGTGLGLAICKGILEAHGEEIWVESKIAKESKFSFSLPLSSL